MITIRIHLEGCDDTNEFDMDVTEDEKNFIARLAQMTVDHSEYECQPILTVNTK